MSDIQFLNIKINCPKDDFCGEYKVQMRYSQQFEGPIFYTNGCEFYNSNFKQCQICQYALVHLFMDGYICSDKTLIPRSILSDYYNRAWDHYFRSQKKVFSMPAKENQISLYGRDGTVIESEPTDDQIELIKLIIKKQSNN